MPSRGYCRACDAAVDVEGSWPGRCGACGAPVEAEPVADVVAPGLRVLFVGINPGTLTARHRMHFYNPRNAFWTALHDAGFTPERVDPADQQRLLDWGLGITNVVSRATPGSADVTPADVEHGRARLRARVRELRPAWLAFVGKEAYRMATGARATGLGEADAFEGARTFVLPSTSPRNAHWTWDEKVGWFRRLHETVTPG